MREILFRGKRKNGGEWVYGYLCRSREIRASGSTEILATIVDEQGRGFAIVPETVGQFTGLTDRNGNKIFEGDYIICSRPIESKHFDKLIEMGYVEMKCGAFGLHRKQGYYRSFKDWLEDYEYEVIGNIHDNPELISGDGNAD